eukprot:scaffold40056_cov14-Prasinocladus_malaysianus.AAC.1
MLTADARADAGRVVLQIPLRSDATIATQYNQYDEARVGLLDRRDREKSRVSCIANINLLLWKCRQQKLQMAPE